MYLYVCVCVCVRARMHYLHSKCSFLTVCVCVSVHFVCNHDVLNNLYIEDVLLCLLLPNEFPHRDNKAVFYGVHTLPDRTA